MTQWLLFFSVSSKRAVSCLKQLFIKKWILHLTLQESFKELFSLIYQPLHHFLIEPPACQKVTNN